MEPGIVNLDEDGYYQIITLENGKQIFICGEHEVDKNGHPHSNVSNMVSYLPTRQATLDDFKIIPQRIREMFNELDMDNSEFFEIYPGSRYKN